MMSIAEGMLAVVEGEVGLPMVMNGPAFELGQDAYGLHRLLSTFAVYGIVGEVVDAGHMQPVQLAFYAEAAFVEMSHIGSDELLLGESSDWVPSAQPWQCWLPEPWLLPAYDHRSHPASHRYAPKG